MSEDRIALNVSGQPFHLETERGPVYSGDATAAQWRWAKVHDKRGGCFQSQIDKMVEIANVLRIPHEVPLIPALEAFVAQVRKGESSGSVSRSAPRDDLPDRLSAKRMHAP